MTQPTAPARARVFAVGAGLAVLYVLVGLVTPRLTGRPVRPLFDGFAPPAPYNWVKPPPEFARDNKKPSEATQDVPLGPDGSGASNVTTADGQAIAGLDIGSAPPHVPDTAVKVRVTPVDPGTLGPLPAGVRAEGNAYQVTLSYLPSGQALTSLAKPGTLALTAAAAPSALLFSPDGRDWRDADARPFGGSNGLFSQLTAPGYFVPVSHNQPRAAAGSGSGVGFALIVLVVAGVLVVGAVVIAAGRRRGRSPTPGPGSAPRRPRGS